MDHVKILKRAWSITWAYPALWVFGIILALTAGARPSNPGSNGNNLQYRLGQGDLNPYHLSQQAINAIIGAVIALVCFFVILAIVGAILRYVSEVSLIRMVNTYEDTGEKAGVRQGFRLGWNRSAFRLFVIDLIVGLASMIVFLVMLAIAASPLLLMLFQNRVLTIIGIVLAVGLIILVIFAFILAAIALNLAMQMIRRACVTEKLGVIASLQRGYQIFRKRLVDLVIMGLILFALGIAYSIVMFIVSLIVIVAALLIAAIPGALVGWIVSLFATNPWPWVIGIIVGLPIFLILITIPLGFIGGLVQTFTSSTWTLTYREAVALENIQSNLEILPPAVSE